MKLHIDIEQLEKLTMEQVCKLNTLLNHEWNLTEEEFKKYNWNKILKDTAEYCTIGRMIKILKQYYDNVEFEDNIYFGKPYVVYCRKFDKESSLIATDIDIFRKYKDFELCNALWKAIKGIL